MTLLLNQLHAISVRLVTPSRGVWFADVDVDLDVTHVVPSGKVALFLGGTIPPLVGTVDPKNSGRFGETAKVRVLGGGGGWSSRVDEKHYHNDAGVLSTAVLATTAAEAGEALVELGAPSSLGVDYVREAGSASSVLEGLDWYVTLQGITVVGPRPTIPASPNIEVLTWDPGAQRAELGTNEVVTPGMLLVDSRFGSLTVREVEQTFTDAGAHATVWCSKSANIADALAAFVLAKSGARLLAAYRYRVVLQGVDERVTLQAIDSAPGLPHLLPITMWPGVPGIGAMLAPGAEVLVEFVAGQKTRPVVRSFDGTPPIMLEITAASVNATVPVFAISGVLSAAGIAAGPLLAGPFGMQVGGDAAEALVKYSALQTWVTAVIAACAAHVPPITIPPLAGTTPTVVLKAL